MRIAILTALFAAAGGAVVFAQAPRPVTFSRDVAPILQRSCQNCHHAGAIAPMSLVTYEEPARGRGRSNRR